ncbi:interleukin-10 receptor subunit alpha [Halichoeres trimaculatus]|uniref:interleukin-10 receptor subunit alpha n=1 Tax=Halichoeres trimaculatus TaxID=147232 RepID=UPI003D9E44D1
MDITKKMLPLVFLMICINHASGLGIPKPEQPEVHMTDGKVVVSWNAPPNPPPDPKYNVLMAKYIGKWDMVKSCTEIRRTYCDLSSFIQDYNAVYKVKVQLATGEDVSGWKLTRKILPNESNLSAPSFTLLATSSTLKLHIHQKPILKKLFPYGVSYIIHLEDTETNKTTIKRLDDDVDEDERSTTFTSLQWGREYCVSLKVEGRGGLSTSAESSKQCLQLPEQEWYIIAVSSLSAMGALIVVAIMAAILHCYLRRPEKTPAALKTPVSGWLPLSVGEGAMEVVTDRGWFLSSYRTETKNCVRVLDTHVTSTEDSEEEDRRTSMDSGVSMESNSSTNSKGNPTSRQEDSGCGSLGGSENSGSSHSDCSLKDERAETVSEMKKDDSGVSLGCQLDSSSLDMDGKDRGSLQEVVSGGGYRSQIPSSVQVQVCDDKEEVKQTLPDLAEVVTGYRASPQSCICSGAGQCTWCHQQDYCGPEVKQYRPVCFDNGLLGGKCAFVDFYKKGITISSYPNETQIDTVMIDDLEPTFIQLKETFPLLTALTPLPLEEKEQDLNMNNVSLSLCDIQLITD